MALFLSRLMSLALILVGALSASGCQAQNQRSEVSGTDKAMAETKIYFDREALVFDGAITPDSASKFAEMAQSIEPGSTLKIRSSSGSPAAALAIADIVIEKKMDLQVTDLCLAYCTMIFAAAKNKKVDDLSIVAFHSSVKSQNDIIKMSQKFKDQEFLIEIEGKEMDFFRKTGISIGILNKADDLLQVVCVGNKTDRGRLSDGTKLAYGAHYIGWVPSLYQMRALGIKNITGYWPESPDELDMLVKKHFAPGVKMRFVRDLALIPDKTPELPPCITQ